MSTITEHPNAAAVRRMYEAVNEKDMGALAALISPDVVFVMPGTSPLAGLYNGRDALFGFFGRMAEVTAGTYHAELRELYASDDSVVAVHHGTGMRRAKELDAKRRAALQRVRRRGDGDHRAPAAPGRLGRVLRLGLRAQRRE
jgi:ketosteroid isomerase-like protein